MEGKVSFSTRYETRTRLVDQAGNEIYEGVVEDDEADSAGTYAEGQNPDTQDPLGENEANTAPPQAAVKEDLKKEKSVEESVVVPEPERRAGWSSKELLFFLILFVALVGWFDEVAGSLYYE
jgi:dolichyl-phosphate-mannose-protein mannosyltransferase